MSFWKKITDKIKIKSDGFHDESFFVNKGNTKQDISTEINFCIFILTDYDSSNIVFEPFIYGSIINIINNEIVFHVDTLTAYSPYDDKREKTITTNSRIKIVLSTIEEHICGCATSCHNNFDSKKHIDSIIETIKGIIINAKVVWTKNNSFGCLITDENYQYLDSIKQLVYQQRIS